MLLARPLRRLRKGNKDEVAEGYCQTAKYTEEFAAMLAAEARWIGHALAQLDIGTLSPVLNVGSSDAAFREQVQPWIHNEILVPLHERGAKVYNLDFRSGDGIDLHGDLTDEFFVAGLADYGFRSLLCCNLLEHVVNPAAICARLEHLVPVGGYLIVTVPNRFPYHPDPIDTMFRPDVEEIVRIFPSCRLVRGEVIGCGTGWDYVGGNLISLVQKVKQRLAGMSENGGVKGSSSFVPWLFREFRQSCVLLQKNQSSGL